MSEKSLTSPKNKKVWGSWFLVCSKIATGAQLGQGLDYVHHSREVMSIKGMQYGVLGGGEGRGSRAPVPLVPSMITKTEGNYQVDSD